MDVADPGNKDKNELDTKVKLSRKLPNIGGNIWWHGYWVTGNYKGAADSLAMKYPSIATLEKILNVLGLQLVISDKQDAE